MQKVKREEKSWADRNLEEQLIDTRHRLTKALMENITLIQKLARAEDEVRWLVGLTEQASERLARRRHGKAKS